MMIVFMKGPAAAKRALSASAVTQIPDLLDMEFVFVGTRLGEKILDHPLLRIVGKTSLHDTLEEKDRQRRWRCWDPAQHP